MICFEVNCSAEVENIELLDHFVEYVLSHVQFTDKRKMCFAVHEAIINAFEATRKICDGQPVDKKILLKVKATSTDIEVLVIDEAEGISDEEFEIKKQKNLGDHVLAESGRGVAFMSHLVDDVWCEKEEGRFILGLRKTLHTQL